MHIKHLSVQQAEALQFLLPFKVPGKEQVQQRQQHQKQTDQLKLNFHFNLNCKKKQT